MSVRRALVDCAVLSVQDACVFYPCCRGCFSRIDAEQQDATRCRCSKCGYRCPREQVEYRYRLSLRVVRDKCIFAVTVFGACLNPYFGIHASGLQRLVESVDGPVGASARTALLVQAIKDCFIGRHFIFDIKVTGTERELCFAGPGFNGSSSKDPVHFIASQMILPVASGLEGCTVVSYYSVLLQKAAEYELASNDPSKTSRNPQTPLRLIPPCSPACSFNSAPLSVLGQLSQSWQGLQFQDSTLSPTPSWQQSLVLVSSSAEQEEGCDAQDSGDENSRQTADDKTLHHVQRGCLESHRIPEERTLSPLLSLEQHSCNSPSFAKEPYTSFEKAVENTPILNSWFSPFQPCHSRDLPLSCKGKGVSPRQPTNTSLSSSLAWEDLPFTQSLREFLYEEYLDFDSVSETKPHLNVQKRNKTVRNSLQIRSRVKNLSSNSASICQNNTQVIENHPWTLLDITNTPASNTGGDRHDLYDQLFKNPFGCVKSQAQSICFQQCNQQDDAACSLSFESKDEEQLGEDTYDCSGDLFSGSLMNDLTAKTLSTPAQAIRTTTEACPALSNPDGLQQRSEKALVPHSTPNKHKLKSVKCMKRGSLNAPRAQDLEFLPPAQSTPIVNLTAVSGSPASWTFGELSPQPDGQELSAFSCDLPETKNKKLAKITAVRASRQSQHGRDLTKENVTWDSTSNRHDLRFTPKRSFWKPNQQENQPLDQRHPRVQRAAANLGSRERVHHKRDSSLCDVAMCGCEDEEVALPPTPAAKAHQSLKLRRSRRRTLTGHRSRDLDSTWKAQQGNGVNCRRILLAHHSSPVTSRQRGLARTGSCDNEMADGGSLDGCNGNLLDDDSQACDWSRDLFSDST